MKLTRQAIEILEELKTQSPVTVSELEEKGFDQSMVIRAVKELEEESLAEVRKEEKAVRRLTDKGRSVVKNGSPEYNLIETVASGTNSLSDIDLEELDVALGKARQKGWIEIDSGEVKLTQEGDENLVEDFLQTELENEEFNDKHEDRGLVQTEITVERTVNLTEKGEELELEKVEEDFNVEARTQTAASGKPHFYKHVIGVAKDVWTDMGFREMKGGYVVPGFTCFDALYIAQDHPARDLQDTFFVANPEKADLSVYGDKVKTVKSVHENGGTIGSKGWGYEWLKEDAEKNILRTHTTAVSAQKLHELDEDDLPGKYFIISRAFRNETVDRTHLADFDQAEGIVVGKDLNFANLKGYLSEFFEKMGYDEFRLIPTYYPYTEMSVEVQVWDEHDEEWLGMGGAGLFRPEVVEPMLGFEATVLAWGLGIGRIGMMAAEIEDIRDLYSNDRKLIEDTPLWDPERSAGGGA